jgi:hypothetical protein
MFRKSHVPTVVVLALALLRVGVCQAQTTTGRIIGKVTDAGGLALPGVSISIESPSLIGGARRDLADHNGEFQFVGLHPGEYTVKADFAGFVSQERQQVKVSLGGAAALNISMPQARFESEIEVVAETPMVDPTQVNTGQVFDLNYMQKASIGSKKRDYLQIVSQAPGVTGGVNPNVFGSTLSENAYFIDGMDTTDPLTGTWGTLYNFDALAEVEVQTSGFEAEYGRATGGLISALTKSGGNQFSGTLDARYRDERFQESGEHFDAEVLDTSYHDIAATLGGPIVRDKLWFFAAYESVVSEDTPVGSPTTRRFDGQNYNLKLSWQAVPRWRMIARASGDPAEVANDNASQLTAPEATARQVQGADIFAGEFNGVLNANLVWNTVVGFYRSTLDLTPMSGDLETPSHSNIITLQTTDNYPNQQYTERHRDDLATDVTWFVGDLAGSHEFKFGLQHSETAFPGANCLTGTQGGACSPGSVGFSYTDTGFQFPDGSIFVVPGSMTERTTVGRQEYSGGLATAYLQDSWRVLSNLTLKLGLRYDQVSYDNNVGRQIADMIKFQPRLGAAWDVTNDAKNVVRANWGRFMNPASLALPEILRAGNEPSYDWFSCSTFGGFFLEIPDPSQCETAAASMNYGYRADDPDEMDPFGWFLTPWNISGVGETLVQQDLRAAYADTLSLSYEREVGRRASVELSIVDKKTRDIFEDTCSGNVPEPRPNADCTQYYLGNLPNLARDYRAAILRFETRTFSWLTLIASYTYSKSEGNIGLSQGANPDFDVFPWAFDHRYGYLEDHRTHRFKLNGFVYFRGDWTIAFDGFWSSAFGWEPRETFSPSTPYIPPGIQYFLEPRGSREGFTAYDLDLQLSKGFAIGNGVRLVAVGSVYNSLSTEYPRSVCSLARGCFEFDTGDPVLWSPPRSYELGFRIEF